MSFINNEITAPKIWYPANLKNSANGNIDIISLESPGFISLRPEF